MSTVRYIIIKDPKAEPAMDYYEMTVSCMSWLSENIGERGRYWSWGPRIGYVDIYNEEGALAFKLKFGV